MTQKPYAPSADNNKAPILSVLNRYLKTQDSVLEIGSGTGQHICCFAEAHPKVIFQPSDLEDKTKGMLQWIKDSDAKNILPPLILNVSDKSQLPPDTYDLIFSANTAHIMSIEEVRKMFSLVGDKLNQNGFFLLYGPFNEAGQFTSDSNASFDQWLKSEVPHRGIRDRNELIDFASTNGLSYEARHTMPANNQILVFQKL